MARFDTSFDATSVEPTTAHELLPVGKYRAQIVESEMRVTKNGMGQFLWLMLDIPGLIWPTCVAGAFTAISGFINLAAGIRQVQQHGAETDADPPEGKPS